MIKINGVELPSIVTYNLDYEDVGKWEGNARATMIGEIIATKRKIILACAFLSREQYQEILNIIKPAFLNVEYDEPEVDARITKLFYKGPRKMEGLGIYDGKMKWKGLSFNLIER